MSIPIEWKLLKISIWSEQKMLQGGLEVSEQLAIGASMAFDKVLAKMTELETLEVTEIETP